MKKAFITGITGQDGSYLAEFLLGKGYEVWGLVRRASFENTNRVDHLKGAVKLAYGDLLDSVSLVQLVHQIQPDEIYNLAAQSSPAESWRQPINTAEITGLGALRIFDAARQTCHQARIYQASSSEMFGKVKEIPQSEKTPFNPANPYAVCKLFAHEIAHVYRQSYQQFIACGILFNHESPRRSPDFVTRKVTRGVACLKLGIKDPPRNEAGEPLINAEGKLEMGNLDAQRDWGFAGDYVEAIWLMLQQEKPDDFVIATGEAHTVRDLCQEAFAYVGLNWEDYVVVNPKFVRPTETGPLIGDANKAKQALGWEPKVTFKELVHLMVEADLASFK